MVFKVVCWMIIITSSFIFTSCGVLEDRSEQYKYAEKGGALKVPEWYSNRRLQDRFPIPAADKSFIGADKFSVPAPPDPGVAISQQQFEIKSLEDDAWLLASEPPGKIWPALKAHWEFYGAQVEELDTANGLMAATFTTNSLKSSQFLEKNGLTEQDRVSGVESIAPVTIVSMVEQGLKRRSSEIRISEVAGDAPDQFVETQLLTSVRQFLDNRRDSFESYSLAAESIGNQDKLVLVDEPGNQFIRVDMDYQRVWHAVGEALVKGKVGIVDWNQEDGIYYVNYANEEEEGWLTGWFASRDESLSDQFNFTIELNNESDGVHILSVPATGSGSERERVRLLNHLLDYMS